MSKRILERRRRVFESITLSLLSRRVADAGELAGKLGLSIARISEILREYKENPYARRELGKRLGTQDFTLRYRRRKLFLIIDGGREEQSGINILHNNWMHLGRRKIITIGNSLAITLPKDTVDGCEEAEMYLSASEDSILIHLVNKRRGLSHNKHKNDVSNKNECVVNSNVETRLLDHLQDICEEV